MQMNVCVIHQDGESLLDDLLEGLQVEVIWSAQTVEERGHLQQLQQQASPSKVPSGNSLEQP